MIVIGFGTNDKLTSRLIRLATEADFSHVWIEDELWGHQMVIHATGEGIVVEPLERVLPRYPKHKRFEVRGADLRPGLEAMAPVVGADYDYSVISNGLLLLLFKLTGWKHLYRYTARNAANYSCSEWVASIMEKAGFLDEHVDEAIARAINHDLGFPESEELDPELLPPSSLFRICVASDACWVM